MYRAYSQHGRREVDVPDFPEDSDRRPWENEIIFQPPEKRRAGKAKHACSYCMKDLESRGSPAGRLQTPSTGYAGSAWTGIASSLERARSKEEIQAE